MLCTDLMLATPLGWDLANASSDALNLDTVAQDPFMQGIFFKPDGTKMYLVGVGNNKVYQYSLATPWTLTVGGVTHDSADLDITALDGTPNDIFFSPDGLNLYVLGGATDTIYQYTLSVAWDLSTATYASKSFLVTSQDSTPQSIFFKPDGTRMFMLGATTDDIFQYTLTTAWDVSTAVYVGISFSFTAEDTSPSDIFFKPDGLKMYMVGDTNDTIFQYSMSSAWDVGTASYDSVSYNPSVPTALDDNALVGAFFKPDGTKMYLVLDQRNFVWQFTVP